MAIYDKLCKDIFEPVNIFGNHMQHNYTEEKALKVKNGDVYAFVNPEEWKEYNLWYIKNMENMINRENEKTYYLRRNQAIANQIMFSLHRAIMFFLFSFVIFIVPY